jgi:hypothetical protein
MSKSYKEQRYEKESDNHERQKVRNFSKSKQRKEKFIHNAIRSNNLSDLIKYSED